MPFGNTAKNSIVGELIGKTKDTLLSNCYIALCTSSPTAISTGSTISEPTASSYARATVGLYDEPSTQVMSNPVNGVSTNSQNGGYIFFPEAITAWGAITHFGLFDRATGGNMYYVGELTKSVTVQQNTIPLFRVGQLAISVETMAN